MSGRLFTFDLNETFPRLARPPIVEAVIHWRARAQNWPEQDALKELLTEKLPGYPQAAPIHGQGFLAKLSKGEEAPVLEQYMKGFVGWRLTSSDGTTMVQCKRDGLVFSRTKSYDHWEPFRDAAKAAWQVYLELAAPVETQRLGVRFINHIADATPETLQAYLREPPTCPSNLPLKEFVYQSTFALPAHPYCVRIIKLMQPAMPELKQSSGLFVDIDVFSTKAVENDGVALENALAEMRWLKNKVFFALLTEEAIRSFGEVTND